MTIEYLKWQRLHMGTPPDIEKIDLSSSKVEYKTFQYVLVVTFSVFWQYISMDNPDQSFIAKCYCVPDKGVPYLIYKQIKI